MIYSLPVNNPTRALDFLQELFFFQPSRKLIFSFMEQMSRGLKGDESLFGMYPTYIPSPRGEEQGLALAVDMGGSNLRVMVFQLNGGGKPPLLKKMKKRALTQDEMGSTALKLFHPIAREVLEVAREFPGVLLPLGFTFSYPTAMSRSNAGTVTRLTKQLTATGLLGQDPFVLLMEEIRKRDPGEASRLIPGALLNDTVTELVYGAYLYPSGPEGRRCDIGGIIGTGANFACLLPLSGISGTGPFNHPEMIINMECGNFDDPGLPGTLYDDYLDKLSPNTGEQRMEKLIAGGYLGQIGGLVMEDLIASSNLFQPGWKLPPVRAEDLSRIEAGEGKEVVQSWGVESVSSGDLEILKKVASFISSRGAAVSALAIGAIGEFLDPGLEKKHLVAMDGSVFGKYYTYGERIIRELRNLFPEKKEAFKVLYLPDGSGMGAGIAAKIDG